MASDSNEKKVPRSAVGFRWLNTHVYIILTVLLLLFAFIYFGLVKFVPTNSETVHEQVITLIEKRRIIPEKQLILLDDKTRQMAEAYNRITEELSDYYIDYATDQADFLGDPKKSSVIEAYFFKYGGVVKRPYYYYFVKQVSSAALYPDARQRLLLNPLIGVFIDGAGSYGLWATHIHSDFMTSEEIAAQVHEYFAVIDMLIFRLNIANARGITSSEVLYELYTSMIAPDFCDNQPDAVNQLVSIIPDTFLIGGDNKITGEDLLQIAAPAIGMAYPQTIIESWEDTAGYFVPVEAVEALLDHFLLKDESDLIYSASTYNPNTQTVFFNTNAFDSSGEITATIWGDPREFASATAKLLFESSGREYDGESVYEYLLDSPSYTYRKQFLIAMHDGGVKLATVANVNEVRYPRPNS